MSRVIASWCHLFLLLGRVSSPRAVSSSCSWEECHRLLTSSPPAPGRDSSPRYVQEEQGAGIPLAHPSTLHSTRSCSSYYRTPGTPPSTLSVVYSWVHCHPQTRCTVTGSWAQSCLLSLGGGTLSSRVASFLLRFVSWDPASFPDRPRIRL